MNDSSSRFFDFALFYTIFYSLMNLTPMPNTIFVVKAILEVGMIPCVLYLSFLWFTSPKVFAFEKIVCCIILFLAFLLLVFFHYRILPELCLLFATRVSVSFDYLLKKIIKYSIVVFCVIFICSLLGISSSSEFIRDDIEGVDTVLTAHSFGFFYYSAPAYLFMNAIVSYLYLNRYSCNIKVLFVTFFLSILVYLLFVTRVQLIVNILMLIVFVFTYKIHFFTFTSKIWEIVALLAFPVVVFFTCRLFSTFDFTSDERLLALNLVLNGRLKFNQEAFELYDVNFLGNMVETSMGDQTTDYFFIDCGYIDILIRYGYIITTFIILLWSMVFYKIYNAREPFLFFWMFLFVFVSFVNNFFFVSAFFSVPLLYGAYLENSPEQSCLNVEADNEE